MTTIQRNIPLPSRKEHEDAIEQLLSSFGDKWSIWPAAAGIVVQVERDGHRENFSGETLQEALQAAANHKWLPKIPPRPRVMNAADWEPKKSNGKWSPVRKGSCETIEVFLKSRRECEDVIKRFSDRSAAAACEWDAKYGNGTDGIDFVIDRCS